MAAGDDVLQVSTPASFQAGALVMVFQATGTQQSLVSGVQSPVDLRQDTVGRWELGRVVSVDGGLHLRAPMLQPFAA